LQGHLVYSFIGELRSAGDGRPMLTIYPVVPFSARLDNQEVAIHTQWILFDEPVTCSIGVWPGPDSQASPIFEVTQTLKPETAPGTVARLGTVSVRLRRELLQAGTLYWVRVFSDDDLVTQYPLKLLAPDSGPRAGELGVH
jgi:hypothetical protein